MLFFGKRVRDGLYSSEIQELCEHLIYLDKLLHTCVVFLEDGKDFVLLRIKGGVNASDVVPTG